MKRSESFLGIHFDFHATMEDHDIGQNVTESMVKTLLDLVKPDYLQVDCKGHPGVSSYPTKVGNPAPDQKKDTLKIWREVTAQRGVSLYMHYSGVWDAQALKKHPSWARVDEKGRRDKKITSVFGPYVDKLLIPQLKELHDVYGVDGVWVDGECWATERDWGKNVLAAFTAKTGITSIPRLPTDEHYQAFTEFCREGFRQYFRHYVDQLHQQAPGFEVAGNWAFTSFMPEPVSADVDFISGDFSLQNSVNSARLEGRCMTRQGKPWDLMAWSFSSTWGGWAQDCYSTKSVVQLQQEAAQVLALGGGFQAYFQQKRDGSVALWQMELMKQVAEFCRQRQEFCHRAVAVPQVGLIYSTHAYYQTSGKMLAHWNNETAGMEGVLHALLDNQLSVEILMEHHLAKGLEAYRLLVVPEWESLGPGVKKTLLDYARGGGQLLVIGAKTTALFEPELGVALSPWATDRQEHWLDADGWLGAVKSAAVAASLKPGVTSVGRLYSENDNVGPWHPAASIASLGKGRIAGVYFDFGERYLNGRTSTSRKFLGSLVAQLVPDPLVTVTGSHTVDVMVQRHSSGALAINLVNTAGPHADKNIYVFDEIPVVGPLTITIRCLQAPQAIVEQPGGRPLPFAYTAGVATLTLSRLEIHTVLMVK